MALDLCPCWIGYLLINPLRKLGQNPDRILGPHVRPGMTVLEIGPAMGFFTLPLARMVGPRGKVVCVDVQEAMLRSLHKRAVKAGIADRIVPRLCPPASLGVDDYAGRIDFALAFAVVHEVPNPTGLFTEVARALKAGARFLVAEPRGHVTADGFAQTLALARAQGLDLADRPRIALSHAALLVKRR